MPDDALTTQAHLPASPARIYNYLLGGTDNYEVDRRVAEVGLRRDPTLAQLARANRAFLIETVRHVAQQRVGQFLDVGSGLPTELNVHEVAQSVEPGARTIYVDNDPATLAHSQALIEGDELTRYILADMRDPHGILTHPEVVRLLDYTQPWALVLCAVLHFVPDADDPYGLVYRFMQEAPPGSYMVFSHVSSTDIDPDLFEIMTATNATLPVPYSYRSVEEIGRFFAQPGWSLLEPGIVDVQSWRPGKALERYPRFGARVLGGVARKDS
ncbi:unnamed protein product [[Actinomadura] parvosata subsp. kistnae]|uniref:Methyltransferase n=1 Tax=[Actinomadura] parvosata subsp. kistnae TaxID=1909395 RepID=A0A1U9ZYP9_9ACTN|nr:SAM-dependent methyltransferase [Nonomuraea sp. ATCC 55076]AQZ63049.1 hypothetical protein BKM31_17685 [Nonomuraea sp. ATCC 55076]SPL98669.1 unnamed protein product [Actinomadura parvosata subsp. kistnae]